MKGWICGLVIGMVVGSAVTTTAQAPPWRGPAVWQPLAKIVTQSEDFQNGYIEGADDVLRLIAATNPRDFSNGTSDLIDALKKVETCLSGGGNRYFTDQELTKAQRGRFRMFLGAGYVDYPAAALLMNSCGPK